MFCTKAKRNAERSISFRRKRLEKSHGYSAGIRKGRDMQTLQNKEEKQKKAQQVRAHIGAWAEARSFSQEHTARCTLP